MAATTEKSPGNAEVEVEVTATAKAPAKSKAKAPEKAAEAPVQLKVRAKVPLFEPYLHIRFNPTVEVPVQEITSWMQCQIDADLMEIVNV